MDGRRVRARQMGLSLLCRSGDNNKALTQSVSHLHSTDSDDKEQLDHEERRQQIDERRARNRA
jgi:hypothetical protein